MKNGKPMQFGVETGSAIAMARNGVTVKTMAEGTSSPCASTRCATAATSARSRGCWVSCGKTMPKGAATAESAQRLIGEAFNAQ